MNMLVIFMPIIIIIIITILKDSCNLWNSTLVWFEDKLSSTTVDFFRSEGNLETKHLYWFRKPKMC